MYEPEKIAESIKAIAKSKKLPLKDMLLTLELNKNTLSNMYKGSTLKSDSLAKIADYLDCSVDYLLGRTDVPELNRSAETVPAPKVISYNNDQTSAVVEESPVYGTDRQIAVLGKVAAGVPILSYENDYGSITPENRSSSYALIVQGDSMAPIILDKEYLEVVIQPELEQGEIGIIRVNDTTTCKKFYEFSDHYELRSINPDYDTIVIKKEPSTDLRIMGKVYLSSLQKSRISPFF